MDIKSRDFKMAMYFLTMSIGKNIRKLRKSKRLTQAELGKAIGARQKVIADYENELSKPPRDRLLALASYFNLSVEKLLGEDSAPQPPKLPEEPKIHGNSRTAKLVQAFEQLTEVEQRVILNQTQALAEKKQGKGKKHSAD
jgi:transcriptional regulator with XRE-family HTH domain